jgi:hypothetical protein
MSDIQLKVKIVYLRKKIREKILEIAHASKNKDFIVYVESILMKPYTYKFNIWSALCLFDVDNKYEVGDNLEELFEVYFGLVQSEVVS